MLNKTIEWVLREAEQRILLAIQEDKTQETWIPVFDEDGNPNVPSDERNVMIFLCGDRLVTDPRPENAGYGIGFGYYDYDKGYWRVGGRPNGYVTHWRECPADPIIKNEKDQ